MRRIVFYVLPVVAGAGIGLAIGLALRPNPDRRTVASAAVRSESIVVTQAESIRVSQPRAGLMRRDDSSLATKLEQNLAMSAGVTRWLYWFEAIEKATPADFPLLARLAQGNPATLRFVAARWMEVDARHLFDILIAAERPGSGLPKDELASILFNEWPKRDPDAAISALNELGHLGTRANWRVRVAMIVFDKDVERGLRLMSEWHIEDYPPRMNAVTKWAEADPRHAAEFTLANAAGFVSRLTMETIGKEWSATDPAGALAFAAGHAGELGSALATAVLRAWSERNLTEAADWLARSDSRTRNRLSATFVETWAKADTGTALAWCQENLTGSTLAQAVGSVLKGAATKDVVAAAGLVAAMNPSQSRAEAAVAVARHWFPEVSSAEPVKAETIAWLGSLDADSMKRVLNEIHWSWVTSDPKSMATFLVGASSQQVPPAAYSILASELVRRDPSEAFDWASHLPVDQALSVGSNAFSGWWSSQPEAAMKWLNDLPSADERRDRFFKTTMQSLAFNPHAVEKIALLTPAERAKARSVFETMQLPEDRRIRLLDALRPR